MDRGRDMEDRQIRDADAEYAKMTDDTVDISMLGYISSLPVHGGEANRVLAEAVGDLKLDQELVRALLDMADEFDNWDHPSMLFEHNAGVFMWAVFQRVRESLQ